MGVAGKALLAAWILLALFTGGCRSERKLPERLQADFSRNSPDVLRLGLYGDVSDLSPIGHHGEYDRSICNLIHAAPLRFAADGSLEGDLFASWVSYPDENGRLIVDGIWKQNLMWHDGTPFDPKALEFTFAAMRDPANASPYAALASAVVEVAPMDRGRRIRIVFPGLSRRYLELLTAGLLPPHLLEGKSIPEAKVERRVNASDAVAGGETGTSTQVLYSEFPVGLGAYRLSDRKRGMFLELEATREAASDTARPTFRRILVKCHAQFETLLNDFRQGRLDWIPVPSEIASKIEELQIPDARFHRYPNPSFLFWGFNLKKPPFDQERVRKALAAGIDKGAARSKIPYDGMVLANMPFPASATGNLTKNAPEAAQTPADLVRLLDGTGLKDLNGDGKRDVNGKPFSMKILVNEENLVRKLVAEEISTQLRRAGIDASVEAISWSELLGTKLVGDTWDSFLLAFQLPRAGNAIDLWHTPTASITESLNYCGVSDFELDGLLEQLDRWPEQASPSAYLGSISERLEAVTPGAFLFRPADVAAWHTYLTGPENEAGMIDMRPSAWQKKVGSSDAPASAGSPDIR
ncbi:MAG TPA: ABC transporter substrate-binding protein [Candidatus Ozemobacteraceae bacterium]|nr:ABC transporter substrate-binding protein [Candidatus Ozemobacteraceae bacterium]